MASNQSSYSNSDIKSLKAEETIRLRPATILGSDGIEGCQHTVFEIISNSVDEAREGYGKVITVTVYRDMTIEVEDKGRGVPMDYNENEKKYNWELVFCTLYAGGKYKNNNGGNYEYSLGMNGLGAAATQFSSEFMYVQSFRDGNLYEMNFKKGKPSGKLKVTPLDKKRTGTVIRWKPDLEVFTDIFMTKEFFAKMLQRQAVVNSGVKFVLKYEGNGGFESLEFLYENNITDYIREVIGDKALIMPVLWTTETAGREREDLPEYKLKVELAFTFTQTESFIEHYHNSSFLEHGGSPDDAMKTAFVYTIDKYLKNNNRYNKNESKIKFEDVGASLVFVSNNFSTHTSYENQTKKAINNKFIKLFLNDYIKSQLEAYLIENPLDAEKIANIVLANKRSRETAERTRSRTRDELVRNIDIKNKVEKFVGCRSKDPEKRELYIVEGDSAMSSCKLGRAAEFQAIIPVRGKTLNCLKSSYDKIFKSDIIRDLLRVIGCGVETDSKVKTDFPKYNIDLLKWSKIIICTDADEDGFQIRTLILTLFYRLLPDLIRQGKVYIAESPLFEITVKDEIFFAYNEFEKTEILAKLEGKRYTIQRSKGLGENEADMMWQTTMNPATRRLIQVSPTDEEATREIFDILLGDNLPARKEFITVHGCEYAKDADV